MSHYRTVYWCNGCGKVYRSWYLPTLYGSINIPCCGKCGNDHIIPVHAKPKMFGFRGWTFSETATIKVRNKKEEK